MTDPNLETRWMAIEVMGTRWLPFQKELIAQLSDTNQAIRQAARKALVRLSRGNDFGPDPKATTTERARAVRRWEQWWAVQDNNPRRHVLRVTERAKE
jgi:hypothetical protein